MQNVWDEIKGDTLLWRYMSIERFINLLNQSRIYFAAANQFDDEFEGAVAIQSNDFPIDPRYTELDSAERAFRELKRLTKVNCWHQADFESDAMWKLYAGVGKGIAICSTVDRMGVAIKPFRLAPTYGAETVWGGLVRYEDLTKIRLRAAMHERFFYKHLAFAWEREFRLIVSLRVAEEFGVVVPEDGIEVNVDLKELVDKIVLGPALKPDECEQIGQRVQQAGLGMKIVKSSLLSRPRYI